MKTKLFTGSCTALVTPFDPQSGKINYNIFEKIVDFQIQNGTKALVFMGTTGESPTITKKEKKQIVQWAVEFVAGRVPVIVGAGSNDTLDAIKKCKTYEKLGADGLLIVTPYYNKCTQDGLVKHYEKICNSVNLPIIAYNVPSRTGVNILPTTIQKISKISNLVAIKEASGNINATMEIKSLCGDDITIYSGDDALTLALMTAGADGVISVVSNVLPKLNSELTSLILKGDLFKAQNLHYKMLPLMNALFCEVNPIPVKYAMKCIGFDVGLPRMPLTELNEANKQKIQLLLKQLKIF